jgi:choline-glycine betaine transporter
MALAYDVSIRNAMLDAITTRAGSSALLRIYDGSRPATGGTATTLLAELTCNATFAPSASSGVLTLNSITQDSSANATGTATWFRIVKSDGTTFVLDGSVGTSGSDLNLTTTSIVATQPVSITSFVITEGNA